MVSHMHARGSHFETHQGLSRDDSPDNACVDEPVVRGEPPRPVR